MSADRAEAISFGLSRTQERITDACRACGRDPAEVTLVVVTKTYPASDVALLVDLGVRDVAENRDQEARVKSAEVASLRPDAELRWHMIGQLQRNKCASVAGWADQVESVDRLALVGPLARAADARGAPLDVLVQLNLDPAPAPGRGGSRSEDLHDVAAAVAAMPSLRLRGVMGVAPLDEDPRGAFAALSLAAAGIRASWPMAGTISAGMSGDLEAAIAAGSTQVRIGSAVLGSREAGR